MSRQASVFTSACHVHTSTNISQYSITTHTNIFTPDNSTSLQSTAILLKPQFWLTYTCFKLTNTDSHQYMCPTLNLLKTIIILSKFNWNYFISEKVSCWDLFVDCLSEHERLLSFCDVLGNCTLSGLALLSELNHCKTAFATSNLEKSLYLRRKSIPSDIKGFTVDVFVGKQPLWEHMNAMLSKKLNTVTTGVARFLSYNLTKCRKFESTLYNGWDSWRKANHMSLGGERVNNLA